MTGLPSDRDAKQDYYSAVEYARTRRAEMEALAAKIQRIKSCASATGSGEEPPKGD